MNVAQQVGGGNPSVFAQLTNTTSQFTVGGSNAFRLHIEKQGTNYVIEGVVRQDGRGFLGRLVPGLRLRAPRRRRGVAPLARHAGGLGAAHD